MPLKKGLVAWLRPLIEAHIPKHEADSFDCKEALNGFPSGILTQFVPLDEKDSHRRQKPS